MAVRRILSTPPSADAGWHGQASMREELHDALKQHDAHDKSARRRELRQHASDDGECYDGGSHGVSTKHGKGKKAAGKNHSKLKALPMKHNSSRRGNSPPHSPRGNCSSQTAAQIHSPRGNGSSLPAAPAAACALCKGLTHQLQSLVQALVELSSSSVKWVAQRKGIGVEDRHHFTELVLNYIQPCASLDPSLEYLRIEIKHALGDGSGEATELLLKQAKSSQPSPRKHNAVQQSSEPHQEEDVELNKAGLKIQARFRGQQARREVEGMKAVARAQTAVLEAAANMGQPTGNDERDMEEVAKSVKKGAVYISRPPGKDQKHQSAEVHKSFDSWAVVSMIAAGSRVVAAGPAKNCGGVVMMPIESHGEFIGVVNLALFEIVQEAPRTEEERDETDKDANKPLNPNGVTKKPNFFARFLPKCTRNAKVVD